MNRKYLVIVLSSLINVSLSAAQEQEQTMQEQKQTILHKVSDGVAWVTDSRVVNFIAKVGGIACAAALFYKLVRMSAYYYTFGDFYDKNDAMCVTKPEFGRLDASVMSAHGRINTLEELPTNAREIKNLFSRR